MNLVENEIIFPLFKYHSIINLEKIRAEKTDENIPMIKVLAKDLMGPTPA